MIAAGGRGRRTGSATLKQFQVLGGRPLITWSVDILVAFGCAPIVVVVPGDVLEQARAILEGRMVVLTEGGESRQASVARGLALVSGARVVVHDAARPFLTAGDVHRVVDALEHADGAALALPVDETLKRVDDHMVLETVDRSRLWRAQTPQAFRTGVLRAAHRRAAEEGYAATDDAQLIERYGGDVVVVEGSRTNLKLTYPEDLALAEAILRRGRT
jgi:2-C-methyl-D-erythritol 4-phosphate cytidylyltransferase